MSKVQLYCVYDGLAEMSVMFMEQPNDSCAVRALLPIFKNKDISIDSLSLILIGVFDREKPEIVAHNRCVGFLYELMEWDCISSEMEAYRNEQK